MVSLAMSGGTLGGWRGVPLEKPASVHLAAGEFDDSIRVLGLPRPLRARKPPGSLPLPDRLIGDSEPASHLLQADQLDCLR